MDYDVDTLIMECFKKKNYKFDTALTFSEKTPEVIVFSDNFQAANIYLYMYFKFS